MLSDLPLAFLILAPCIGGFLMMLVVSVLAAGADEPGSRSDESVRWNG
jgi:hypothetical protein